MLDLSVPFRHSRRHGLVFCERAPDRSGNTSRIPFSEARTSELADLFDGRTGHLHTCIDGDAGSLGVLFELEL